LFQVRLVAIEGIEQAICPRHFGAFQRYLKNELNLKWLADEEFSAFLDKFRMDKLQSENDLKRARGEVVQDSSLPDIDDIVSQMFDGKLGNQSKE
jgi:hypothetical protein